MAARLGRLVGTGGSDPMRSFPFLLEAGGPERVSAVTGIDLPETVLDPERPEGKGALVWWHENLVAAVDLVGFCAFSTAGLLADGVRTLDELAGSLLPQALRVGPAWSTASPGAALLAAGASLVVARQLVDRALGSRVGEAGPVRGALADALLEYGIHRGWTSDGEPNDAVRQALGTPRLARSMGVAGRGASSVGGDLGHDPDRDPGHDLGHDPDHDLDRRPGRVLLLSSGALAAVLGTELAFEADLPCSLAELLARLADAPSLPASAGRGRDRSALLVDRDGRPLPSVWRAGRRLHPSDLVHDGDRLDLVAAIAGG